MDMGRSYVRLAVRPVLVEEKIREKAKELGIVKDFQPAVPVAEVGMPKEKFKPLLLEKLRELLEEYGRLSLIYTKEWELVDDRLGFKVISTPTFQPLLEWLKGIGAEVFPLIVPLPVEGEEEIFQVLGNTTKYSFHRKVDVLAFDVDGEEMALYPLGEEISLEAYRKAVGMDRVKRAPYYFFSDTHFGHEKIIDYASRPFEGVEDMDRFLARNWKEASSHGTLFFLGDLAYKKTLPNVGGRVLFLKGDHDGHVVEALERKEVPYYREWDLYEEGMFITGNKKFLDENYLDGLVIDELPEGLHLYLTHNPEAPMPYLVSDIETRKAHNVWVVHGHVHNHNMDRWPFINFETHTINVAVELIDYKPLPLEDLIHMIKEGKKRGLKKVWDMGDAQRLGLTLI